MKLLIVMPVYEDWASAAEVCRRIDASIGQLGAQVQVLLINDGSRTSWDNPPGAGPFASIKLTAIEEIGVVELHRNLGHQRAIAVGLAYTAAHLSADALVVMDADGEDPPEQIALLMAEAGRHEFSSVVFAERGRRVEGWLFRFFYLLYRALHYLLTGRKIRVGNFSVLPWKLLNPLIVYPELWNHYAAAVLQSRLPCAMIRLDRGTRIHGKSKMGFVDLVTHGLSALFAYHDLVGTRLLIGNFLLIIVAAAALLGLFAMTNPVIAPAAKVALVVVIVTMVGQISAVSLLAIFLMVMNRTSYPFLPARDYGVFVRERATIVRKTD
jgi:polyisoprenyl-phosphate glycosyltransferase